MTPLLFLDTETSGLCPDIHTPWEVAWQTALHIPDDFRGTLLLIESAQAFVKLSDREVDWADKTALEIGRFEARYGVGSDPIQSADVMMMLQADIANISRRVDGNPVPHLVGAVPSFDHAMLCNKWLGWPGFGEGLWHYHLVCCETLAAGKLGIPPPYSSSQLTAALGITVDESTKHTAAGDVEWAMKMYAAVYDLEIVGQDG